MKKSSAAMHVTRVKSRVKNKTGEERVYESVLLRRSFREDGKVKHATLANLSALPDTAIEDLRASRILRAVLSRSGLSRGTPRTRQRLNRSHKK